VLPQGSGWVWCSFSILPLGDSQYIVIPGYGATTFPALTEAFTVDHNATEGAWEAERLTTLLQKLAPQIQPSSIVT
jgi:hypothetical protein